VGKPVGEKWASHGCISHLALVYLAKIKSKGGTAMGLRAYLMVNVADDMEQQEFIKVLRQMEGMPGVDFVDPVIGSHDMVMMVDAPVTVEALASKIREKSWVKDMEILRIVGMFERHRASKKELLKASTHSGL
jgi:DNA-binding Lrp family transcriptional regulator